MPHQIEPEILCFGSEGFRRYVIVTVCGKSSEERMFWTGAEWAREMRAGLLFADRVAVLRELREIRKRP